MSGRMPHPLVPHPVTALGSSVTPQTKPRVAHHIRSGGDDPLRVALASEVDKHTCSIRKRQPIAVEGVKRSSITSRGGLVVPKPPMHTATHQGHPVVGRLNGEGRQGDNVRPSVAETTSASFVLKSSVKKAQSAAPLRPPTKAAASTFSGVKTAPPGITRSTSHQSPFEHVSTGADLFHSHEPRLAHLLDPAPPTQTMNPDATIDARRRKKSASARFSTMAVLEAPCRSSDSKDTETHAALLRLWSDKTEQLRAQLNHVPSSSQTQASGSAQTISKEEYQNASSSSTAVPSPSSRTRTTSTAHSHLEDAKTSNKPEREFDLSLTSRHQQGNAKSARAGQQSDTQATAAPKHDSTVTSFSSVRQYDAEPIPESLPVLDLKTNEDVPATISRLRKPRPLDTLTTPAIPSGPAASPTSPDDHKPLSPNGLPSPPFSPRGNMEKPSIATLLKQSAAMDPPLRARSTSSPRVVYQHSARHSRAIGTPENVTAPPTPISPSDETSSPTTISSSDSVTSDANTHETSDGYSEHSTDKHPNPAGSSSSSHPTVPSSQSAALEAGYGGCMETTMEQYLSPSATSASESRCVSWVGFPVPVFPIRETSTQTREESVPIVETEPPPRRWSAIDWALEIPIPSELTKWDLERMVWTHDLTHCEYDDGGQLISATFFEFFRLLAYCPGWQYKDKVPRRDDDELRVAFWALFRHHLPASELLEFVRAVYRIYSDFRPGSDYVQRTLDFFIDQLCTEWFGFWVKDTDEPIASDIEDFIREDVAPHSKEYAGRLLAAFRARNREGMFGSPYVLDVPPAYEKLPCALQLQLPPTPTMPAFEHGPHFEEFVRQLTLVLHHAYKALPPPMVLVLGWHFVVHDRGYVGPEQPFLDLCESLRKWVIYDVTTAAADDLYPLVRFWLRVEHCCHERFNMAAAAAIFAGLDAAVCRGRWGDPKNAWELTRTGDRTIVAPLAGDMLHEYTVHVQRRQFWALGTDDGPEIYWKDLLKYRTFSSEWPLVPHLASHRALALRVEDAGSTTLGWMADGQLLLNVAVLRELKNLSKPLERGYRLWDYTGSFPVREYIKTRLADAQGWTAPSFDAPAGAPAKPEPARAKASAVRPHQLLWAYMPKKPEREPAPSEAAPSAQASSSAT